MENILDLEKDRNVWVQREKKKKTVDKRTAKKITTKNESRSKKSPEKRNVNKNATFRKKGKAKK